MERVKEGEVYWYIDFSGIWYVDYLTDLGDEDNITHYITGNYFHTKEEAESMIYKFKAVLKGAEMIEMPSDIDEALQFGDTEQEMKRKINEKGKDRINEFAYGWNACRNFMESKIVK